MTATKPWARRAASACCLVLLLFVSAAAQQQASQPPLPSAPDSALIAGWDVYVKKDAAMPRVRAAERARRSGPCSHPERRRLHELGAAMWTIYH